MTRVLALDVGTSSVRARIYGGDGFVERDEVAQTRYDVTHGRGGRAELDADHIVDATRAAIDAVVEPGERVDAVGVSCFWHSLLPLDARGRVCGPLLIWQDTRSAAQAERLARRLDAAAVHARTGCPFHPSFWPAKLLWLREERRELFDGAARFACFSEHLLRELVGEARTSASMASGTGLRRLAGGWDEELLEALGVEPERLPDVSDEPLGEREPWFPALGDGACSNVGAGCEGAGRAALTIGTSGALRLVRPLPTKEPPHPALFRYLLDAATAVEGGSVSDGGNLYAWLDRTLRLPETREVSLREPDAHGLTMLPFLGGERSPRWDGRARGALAGLTFDTTPLDLLQASLEAVAYRFAEIAEALPGLRHVVATGGALAASPDWVQLLADALERPLELSPVAETSARGAAVVALRRLGEEPAAPPPGRLFAPRAERAGAYRSARRRQRDLERRLA